MQVIQVANITLDWAIVFDEKEVKYIYFIAETKGSLDSFNIRRKEEIKIDCAKNSMQHFHQKT